MPKAKTTVFTEHLQTLAADDDSTIHSYSVAITMFTFGGSFSAMGTIRFPKTVCCRWTSNEVQSWTFSHTDGTYEDVNTTCNRFINLFTDFYNNLSNQ